MFTQTQLNLDLAEATANVLREAGHEGVVHPQDSRGLALAHRHQGTHQAATHLARARG